MTFDEWFAKSGWADFVIETVAIEVWNAAIKEAIKTVGAIPGDGAEELQALKKLLTK